MREVIGLLDALEHKLHRATAVCAEEDTREAQLRQQLAFLRAQLNTERCEAGEAFAARKAVLDGRLRAVASEANQLEDIEQALAKDDEQEKRELPQCEERVANLREELTCLLKATNMEVENIANDREAADGLESNDAAMIQGDISELKSKIVVATKNLEALRRLDERQTKMKDELKTHIWEVKTKVFSIIKDNETLDKEIHAAVKKREAAAASARRERYSRLTERQKSASRTKQKPVPRPRATAKRAPRRVSPDSSSKSCQPRPSPPAKRAKTLRDARGELMVRASTLIGKPNEGVSDDDFDEDISSLEFSLSDDSGA